MLIYTANNPHRVALTPFNITIPLYKILNFFRETNIRETNILFSYLLQQSAIQNKILQQTKIPITIPYIHSINIYKHNNIILELTLLPRAQTENFLDESRIVCKIPLLERALGLKKASQARARR